MTWVLVLLLGLLAVPLTIEYMRTPMTDRRQAEAPGKLATLSQGVTHYTWLGPARGPVAVCVHGLTTPSFVWHGLAKGLALMGYRVLIYDHFGRGYSSTVRGLQDAAFFVTQLEDLLAHENVEEPVLLIGYSMGGAVAACFAAKHGERVSRLVLLASAGMALVDVPVLRIARDVPVIGDWLFLAVYPIVLRRGIVAEAELPKSVEGMTHMMQAETTRRGYFPAALSSLRGVLRASLKAEHTAIADAGVPVLAVWGENDDLITPAAQDQLAAWNPDAAQAVIAGSGHGVTYTHTDDVVAQIKAWIG
ncbi:MAG: alpha/beta hydrolase [Pseudomonadota bacterium]